MPFLNNKSIKIIGTVALIFLALIVVGVILLNSIGNQSFGISTGTSAPMSPSAPSNNSYRSEGIQVESDSFDGSISYYPTFEPGSISRLENYETTNYTITARTKQFDSLCEDVENLKANPDIDFKFINSSTNNCQAHFYADTEIAESVLETFTAFSGVEIKRNTESVTRHKDYIESQTIILEQQLSTVERSLSAAERQFDEIADFARQSKDAATLSEAIRYKLENIDTLTQRKINLTAQLDRMYQEAAELSERIGVVEFSVSIYRSNPIYPNRYSQKWDAAWNELKDQFTETAIGLTTVFVIFILWAVRITIYLLVVLLLARVLWKVGTILWQKK